MPNTTYQWHYQDFGVQSPDTGVVLQGINHKFDIPDGFSLQRVIMKAGLWGNLWFENSQFVPAPVQFGCAAQLWTEDDALGSQFFYDKYTPCRYDLGWQQTEGLGGKFYWTLSGTDLVDCDVNVRLKNTPQRPNVKLAFELQMLIGGTLVPGGAQPQYPSYQCLASVRYLTSHSV